MSQFVKGFGEGVVMCCLVYDRLARRSLWDVESSGVRMIMR